MYDVGVATKQGTSFSSSIAANVFVPEVFLNYRLA
jgi:hypothetical protein